MFIKDNIDYSYNFGFTTRIYKQVICKWHVWLFKISVLILKVL